MAKTQLVDLAQPLPPALYERIGELTVSFGRLEHMVLLAIKRKLEIPLEEAAQIYMNFTLGGKLFGKGSKRGLKSFLESVDGLDDVFDEIEKLNNERGKIMHGLIVTDKDGNTVLSYRNKPSKVEPAELIDLNIRVIKTIVQLNQLIPIPGLSAGLASPTNLDFTYDPLAIDPDDDPFAKPLLEGHDDQ